ncbi:hypothetical protein K3495_g13114 [Podosphaera aphanis]|nr:hypothetical protein K3495_g13114 [Podosphaera aphanis]
MEIKDIPATDLFVHRARLEPGTKPHRERRIIQQTDRQKFWLQKTIEEGLESGMYERVPIKNGGFSDWSAGARVVEKPGSAIDMRVTFNYHNVREEIPGTFMELMSEIHDYLSLPQHKCFLQMDIKHAYWSIPVHESDRYIYAFFIPGIGQFQPTRMPQGCGTSGFSMQELMQIVWGALPPVPRYLVNDENHPIQPEFSLDGSEPSLLRAQAETEAAKVRFYVDDIFAGCNSVPDAYVTLRDHLLPRLDWANLRLSFKKLKLFSTNITALGLVHKAGGIIEPKVGRADKIRQFPVPKNQSEIRSFLGMTGIMRRFIPNYSEISPPLSRLQGDVPWRWDACEQVSFDFLKERVASVTDSNGHDPHKACSLCSDVSGFAAGCCITQKRVVQGSTSSREQDHPILFDSFLLNKTERNYGTYKSELFGIVSFCRKFSWMFMSHEASTIFTDHKPLIYFMDSHLIHGIYSRWAEELNLLNVRIEYIPGERNRIADALSRTIFRNEDCSIDEILTSMGSLAWSDDNQPHWVWKDGVGGYQDLLNANHINDQHDRPTDQVIQAFTASIVNCTRPTGQTIPPVLTQEETFSGRYSREDIAFEVYLSTVAGNNESPPPDAKYANDEWYGEI